jgi:peptidoglycan hydrolase CwlO-like protein
MGRRTPLAAGWTTHRSRLSAARVRRAGLGRLLVAFLVLPLLIGLAGPPAARGDELADAIARQKALAAQVKKQRAEVARIRALQGDLSSEIAATRSALDGINADLAKTKTRISRLTKRVDAVQAAYEELVAQVELLDRQVVAIEEEQAEKATELKDRRDLLAARIREAYRTDRTPLVQAFLSAGTFTDLLEDVGAYLDLGDQDRALADRIEDDARTLDALRSLLVETRIAREELREETLAQKKELDARVHDLKIARRQLAALQKETERELASQRSAYAKMAKSTSDLKAAIAASVAAQKRLEKRIARLVARERSLGNIPSQYNGTLRWPLAGSLTQEYGCTGFAWEQPLGSCAHFHQGIDIAAPM